MKNKKIIKYLYLAIPLIIIMTSVFVPLEVFASYNNNKPSVVPGLTNNTSNDPDYGGHAGYYIFTGSIYTNSNVQPYIPFRTNLRSRTQAWVNNQWNAWIFKAQGTSASNYQADGVIYYYFNDPVAIRYAEIYTINPESAGIAKPDTAELVWSEDGEEWEMFGEQGSGGVPTVDYTKRASEGKITNYYNYFEQPGELTKHHYWGIRLKKTGAEFTGATKIFLMEEDPESNQTFGSNETGFTDSNTYLEIDDEHGIIDSGITAKSGQTMYIDCILPTLTTDKFPLMGQEPDYGRSIFIQNYKLAGYKSSNGYIAGNIGGNTFTMPNDYSEKVYRYYLDSQTIKMYSFNQDGTTSDYYTISATADYTTARNIYIGGINSTTPTQTNGLKIRAAKIIENGTAVFDGIACIDGNGKQCLYDSVSQKYFYRDGGTSAGTIANAPNENGGPAWWNENQGGNESGGGGGAGQGFGFHSDNSILQTMLDTMESHLSDSLFFDDLIEFKNILLSVFQEDYSSGQAGLDALGVFNITMRRPTVTEVHEFGNDTIGSWTQEYERPTSNIDYGLNNQRIADFSWFFGNGNYRGVKYYTDIIISGFLWIVFAWYLWHNMPTIIGGDVMSTVTTGIGHENKVYTAKKKGKN